MPFLLRLASLVFVSIATLLPVHGAGEEGYAKEVKRTVLFQAGTDALGHPLVYPKGEPQLTGVIVEVPPGTDTGWHVHPHPCIGYVLDGDISLEVKDHPTRQFKAGDSLVEVVNTCHRGVNTGDKPVRILFFAIGEKGTPIAVGCPVAEKK